MSFYMQGGRPSESAAEDTVASLRNHGFHFSGIAVSMRPDTTVTDAGIFIKIFGLSVADDNCVRRAFDI